MRTEFLVVGRATMPDEEEQYKAYTKVVKAFGDHPIVIRTFDVGGDKLPVGGFPSEPNPFPKDVPHVLSGPILSCLRLRPGERRSEPLHPLGSDP